MKILIDFTQIPVEKFGVGIYAVNLVRKIAKLDAVNKYYVLLQDDEKAFNDLKASTFTFIRLPSRFFRSLFFRIVLEQVLIPCIAAKHRIDLIHSLHYSFPLFTPGVKKVVTVHDMTFFKCPQYHKPIKNLYFRFFIYLSAKLAYRVVTISESTRKDYRSITGASAKKTVMIHLGKNDWSECTFTEAKIQSVKNRYGISKQYLLFLGTIEPRKNLPRLIGAHKRLINAGNGHQLVIIGKKGWKYHNVFRKIEALGLKDHITFTGYIEEADKPYLIKGATVFIYPSLYEGFGIPVIEALSLGIPTITSNISSMPEITRGATLLVNPYSEAALFEAISKLLSDQQLHINLKKRSLVQANQFCWEKTAYKTISLYGNNSQ